MITAREVPAESSLRLRARERKSWAFAAGGIDARSHLTTPSMGGHTASRLLGIEKAIVRMLNARRRPSWSTSAPESVPQSVVSRSSLLGKFVRASCRAVATPWPRR